MPRPVATTALTFVLALAGKLFLKDKLTRSGRWHERMDHMGMGLTGRTLGVIGAGRIGQEILRMARTFDLKLLAADPVVNEIELAYLGARKVELATLLNEADFVVVCCLLNERTRHLVGARELAQMRPGAYFINVARGPIVDEPALIKALSERRIAGAALDVFEQEPLPAESPLRKAPNLVLTPHLGASTHEAKRNVSVERRRSNSRRGPAQFDKRRQESGQCLAGSGRGNQQRGTVFTRLRQQLKLVFARTPSAPGEPSAETVWQQRGALGRRSGDDAGRHGKTGKPLRRFRRGPTADECRPLP